MVGGRAVEGGRDDLTLHGALHVGDLFRAFIDEHDHEVHLGIVHSDRIGDVLQRDRLASFRRRDDQAALALADRRNDVDQAADDAVRRGLHTQALVGVQRRELAEVRAILCLFHA